MCDAFLVCPPTGDLGDNKTVMRHPKDTRPISLSNTDVKNIASAANEPLKHQLDGILHPAQFGGVCGRQLLDAACRMDAKARIACKLDSHAAMLFFDFATAFPALVRSFLFYVLVALDLPPELINLINQLYANNDH